MNKLEIFDKELNYIRNEKYRESVEKLIALLPDYFFEIPASSTGKYHPKFALTEGGLVKHTKVAVRLAWELLYNNKVIGNEFNEDEKDLIIIALILHDGLKSGIEKNKYTKFEHPLLMSNYVNNCKDDLSFSDNDLNLLISMIEAHSGEWTTSCYSDTILPEPTTKYQKFVHMCDFLASRKFIDVNFENNQNID